ncbi:MAG: hypothetical protein ACOCUU_01775 [Nanoarchaeota archaeon]
MKNASKLCNWIRKNKETTFLGIILIFAFYLRIYNLGVPSFWIDEAISTTASLNILEKGVPIFDSGILYSRALFFHYFQAMFLLIGKIFNMDFFARFSSVFFGLLTIVLGYFIGKEYSLNKKKAWISGIIVALFFGIFSLQVFYSKQARFYQLFQLLFFSCLFFLYKSKENSKFLYVSLICFFITINTQIQGLVLAPFFVLHILIYSKGKLKYLAILPVIPLIRNFFPVLGLTQVASSGFSESTQVFFSNYFKRYFSFTKNILYFVILSFPGVIWSYLKNKRLTLLIFTPCFIAFLGILNLQVFAFRYSYFFFFIIILYSALLFCFLYEKYGKSMFIPLILILLIPSNLFFPLTYGTVLKPIDSQMFDSSAPVIEYKNIPESLLNELKKDNTKIITYFSPSVEYYIKKPDYVLPFSMDGRGKDSISRNNSEGKRVDVYSGALIIEDIENILETEGEFYFIASSYAVSKLKGNQTNNINYAEENCIKRYSERTFRVYFCE